MEAVSFQWQRSSNAFGRARDAHILWLLERHPVTAGMLVEIKLFTSKSRAVRRLRRLCERKLLRIAGTVLLKDGRPEHVFSRYGRPVKADNVLHEIQWAGLKKGLLTGAAVAATNLLLDSTLVQGTRYGTASLVGDVAMPIVAMLPTNTYVKGALMAGSHAAGRLIDKYW